MTALFGPGNLLAHAIRGDDLGHGNWAKYFFAGTLAGLGVDLAFGPIMGGLASLSAMPGLSGLMGKSALLGITDATALNTLSTLVGLIGGPINQGWKGLANAGKTILGNFYLDENKSFFGQVWEGISRHTWEYPQQVAGYFWSMIRNCWAERVDFWGGSTFVSNFNNHTNGVTLGNYNNLNFKMSNEIYSYCRY